MNSKTILSTVPPQLKGRGHNRCVPMRCDCGSIFLFALSDGTDDQFDTLDQVDIRCPSCGTVTSEPTTPLRNPATVFNGQAGLPESSGVFG